MTTEEAIDAYLDLHPGDMQARRELSDLYEEQGRDAEAEGMRWLIREGKWPHFCDHDNPRYRAWHWYFGGWDVIPTQRGMHPHAWVGPIDVHYRSSTRKEAEAELIAHAHKAGLIGQAVPA